MAVATTPGGADRVRWLVVPATVVLLGLIGLALSTEDRDRFEQRTGLDSRAEATEGSSDGGGGSGGLPDQPIERPDVDPTDGSIPDSFPDGDGGRGGGTPQGPGGPGDRAAPVDVEIRSPDGSVGIDLEPGGSVAHGTGDPGRGPILLTPSPDGDVAGLRITDDGRLEPVPAGQLRPDDLILRPVEGGVDILRPDGSVIQLRPGPDGRVRATEVAPDGTVRPLDPGPDGEIPLDDDTSVFTAPTGGPVDEPPGPTPWRWIFGAIVAVVVASLAWAWFLWRSRPDDPSGASLLTPQGVPVDRFEEFLARLRADTDHSRAIRLAFQAAERGEGGVPCRTATETPFEWSERVTAERPDVAGAVSELCALFTTARFAPDLPTAADRHRAVDLLRDLHLSNTVRVEVTPDPAWSSEPAPESAGGIGVGVDGGGSGGAEWPG